jgi:hypothetical protein
MRYRIVARGTAVASSMRMTEKGRSRRGSVVSVALTLTVIGCGGAVVDPNRTGGDAIPAQPSGGTGSSGASTPSDNTGGQRPAPSVPIGDEKPPPSLPILEAGVDRIEPTVGVCCPPSPQPGCCMKYGGWAALAEDCGGYTCDGMPLPSDPSWVVRPDEHGCPRWQSRPFDGTSFCGQPRFIDDFAEASAPPCAFAHAGPCEDAGIRFDE